MQRWRGKYLDSRMAVSSAKHLPVAPSNYAVKRARPLRSCWFINPKYTCWWIRPKTPRWSIWLWGSRKLGANTGRHAAKCWMAGSSQAWEVEDHIPGSNSWMWDAHLRCETRNPKSARETTSNPISVRGASKPIPPYFVGNLAWVH